MVTRVYLLLGGLQSWDGYITSQGMFSLKAQLERKGIPVEWWTWADYLKCHSAIMYRLKTNDKIAAIGFSGGAAHLTWLARGFDYRSDKVRIDKPKAKYSLPMPRIDLLVSYDASPKEGVFDLTGTNVKRALCYYNETPLMLGLGGGRITGPQVEEIPIRIQHFAVQYNQALHDRTVKEICAL